MWVAMANRRAYSMVHPGLKTYVATSNISDRVPTWDKLPLSMAIFDHSHCPEWLWLLDSSDAFIMNLSIHIKDVIHQATVDWRKGQGIDPSNSSSWPDVIMAKDCNGINTGSMILRNTPWTKQDLEKAWHPTDYQKFPVNPEQSAIADVLKNDPEANKHYQFVNMQLINSYAPLPTERCGHKYEEGDFILHFPGGYKKMLKCEKLGQTVGWDEGFIHQVPLQPPANTFVNQSSPHFFFSYLVHTVETADGLVTKPWLDLGNSSTAKGFKFVRRERNSTQGRNIGWPLPYPSGLVSNIFSALAHRDQHVPDHKHYMSRRSML